MGRMTRKERKLRKLVDKVLTWSRPDQHIEELIEVAHKIEGRRIAQAVELGLRGERVWNESGRSDGMHFGIRVFSPTSRCGREERGVLRLRSRGREFWRVGALLG